MVEILVEIKLLVLLGRCPTVGNLQRLYLIAHLQCNVKGAAAILQPKGTSRLHVVAGQEMQLQYTYYQHIDMSCSLTKSKGCTHVWYMSNYLTDRFSRPTAVRLAKRETTKLERANGALWPFPSLLHTFTIPVRPRFWLTKTHKLDEN